MISIHYFASLREHVGTDVETLALPTDNTIEGLVKTLKARNGVWAQAFDSSNQVLAAINHQMAQPEKTIQDGDEIAFFPPVTGG
jgi:sulfur-carrier protein